MRLPPRRPKPMQQPFHHASGKAAAFAFAGMTGSRRVPARGRDDEEEEKVPSRE